MEAPEKIYISTSNIEDNHYSISKTANSADKKYEVEYIRTDAFIEKAWDWIEDNILSSNQQDKSRLYCEQFRNYMKGE